MSINYVGKSIRGAETKDAGKEPRFSFLTGLEFPRAFQNRKIKVA